MISHNGIEQFFLAPNPELFDAHSLEILPARDYYSVYHVGPYKGIQPQESQSTTKIYHQKKESKQSPLWGSI